MEERNPTNWRAWAAGAVFLALLLGAIAIIRPAQSPDRKAGDIEAPEPPPPALPAPPPPLNRSDLIDAANRAAEAVVTGSAIPEDVATLAGRRFALVLPFGCNGPDDEDRGDDAYWSYDEDSQTLRASVLPQSWSRDEIVRETAQPLNFEAAEGFWISRPWIRSGNCPRTMDAKPPPSEEPEDDTAPESGEVSADAVAVERETLAIIEFFAPGTPRAARRSGRPYTLSVRIAPDEADLSRGLRLVVEGRLAALPDGRAFACRVENSKTRPTCLISADFTKVAITDTSGERTLAEWSD